jgi:cytochrome c-type biogenesis protein CcmH/NrfG
VRCEAFKVGPPRTPKGRKPIAVLRAHARMNRGWARTWARLVRTHLAKNSVAKAAGCYAEQIRCEARAEAFEDAIDALGAS